MIEIVSDIQKTIENRIKNPLLIAFFISWVAVHAKEILYFLYSSNEQKLILLHNYKFALLCDFALPAAFTIGYVIILPLINIAYLKKIKGPLDERLLKVDALNKANESRVTRRINRSAVIASNEYVNKVFSLKLERWSNEREDLNKKNLENTDRILTLEKQINDLKDKNNKLASLNSERNSIISHYQNTLASQISSLSYSLNTDFLLKDKNKGNPKAFCLGVVRQYINSIAGSYLQLNKMPLIVSDENWVEPINGELLKHFERSVEELNKLIDSI
ncbi:hypothetical protein [Aeromonas hydrophila]|uniref:hypothetical protein n=1 Tax=Aeromonas hydrophila TaxID=644 RepID=UPI001C5AB960|nr:hypothetical protein [Aeromonas hydrophila]MBW3846202.1 hypothetical protein [Aeromonas hydrophila]